jgi:hypothetical protein
MKTLPIPPAPHLEPPTHGKRAAYFGGCSTADLIQLVRQRAPASEEDYEAVREGARRRGEVSYFDFLIALHERASREVFDAAASLCRYPDPDERILGLRILRELGEDRPVFPETWELLEDMAETEEDADVLWWVISCLLYTRKDRALDSVLRFIYHADSGIREHIAFMIVGTGDVPNDLRIVETQLRLAEDEDLDGRYGAVYNFVEDITADGPAIREMLRQRLKDPDEHVHEKAAEALRVREGQEA